MTRTKDIFLLLCNSGHYNASRSCSTQLILVKQHLNSLVDLFLLRARQYFEGFSLLEGVWRESGGARAGEGCLIGADRLQRKRDFRSMRSITQSEKFWGKDQQQLRFTRCCWRRGEEKKEKKKSEVCINKHARTHCRPRKSVSNSHSIRVSLQEPVRWGTG